MIVRRLLIISLFIFLTVPAFGAYKNVYNPYTGKMDKVHDISDDIPASVTSSCVPTQIAYDDNYFYVCVGTNSWKRVQLAAWAVTDRLLMSDGTSLILLSDGTSKLLIRP